MAFMNDTPRVLIVPSDAAKQRADARVPLRIEIKRGGHAHAIYADGSRISGLTTLDLLEAIGLEPEDSARWRVEGESDEDYRIRQLPSSHYRVPEWNGVQWAVYLDTDRAFVFREWKLVGTARLEREPGGKTRVIPYPGQPDHVLKGIKSIQEALLWEREQGNATSH